MLTGFILGFLTGVAFTLLVSFAFFKWMGNWRLHT
jgi:hypothetical protein